MFGFDCAIHILLRLDLKNVHFQIAKKGMSRYVEIKHNGNDIVLCLASSVEQAKSECGDPEQYESWIEVQDGTLYDGDRSKKAYDDDVSPYFEGLVSSATTWAQESKNLVSDVLKGLEMIKSELEHKKRCGEELNTLIFNWENQGTDATEKERMLTDVKTKHCSWNDSRSKLVDDVITRSERILGLVLDAERLYNDSSFLEASSTYRNILSSIIEKLSSYKSKLDQHVKTKDEIYHAFKQLIDSYESKKSPSSGWWSMNMTSDPMNSKKKEIKRYIQKLMSPRLPSIDIEHYNIVFDTAISHLPLEVIKAIDASTDRQARVKGGDAPKAEHVPRVVHTPHKDVSISTGSDDTLKSGDALQKPEGADENGHPRSDETATGAINSDSSASTTTEAEQYSATGAQTVQNAKSATPVSNVGSNSKPKPKRKNNEDKYQMYIGYRMSTENKDQREHAESCDLDRYRQHLTKLDNDIKAYYSDRSVSKDNNGTLTVLHIEYPGVTAEMLCLWNHLDKKVSPQKSRSDRYAMYQSEEPETSMQLDMISETTLLYTNRRSNRIVIIHDAEVVRVAEVLVSVGKGFKPRVVLYTDSCLRLTEGLISKSKVKKEMRILLFCLLIVTGWGLYAKENQTTEISFADSYNSTSEWTVSVKQGATAFTMFDTNTEFVFTETGGSSAQAKRSKEGAAASLRDSSKSDKSESTGSASSQNLSDIVTRAAKAQASASKQAIQATHNMKLRSAVSKADEAPDTAKQAGKTAKKKAGEAFNKKAANNASDTSSSDDAIAHHTRSKTQNMSEQLAKKNNGNKSK